jgi:hypothetical protein
MFWTQLSIQEPRQNDDNLSIYDLVFFQASGPGSSINQTGPWDIVCVMLMSVYMCVVSMEELDLYVYKDMR